ncbi:conserved hypothetical protein [Histoplasma capsulatum var. duboisii H88]|uniref:Uncharacterized protein n=2 Tax=Ajellomyces capsulatus TaxID=5037 RepID=F0UAB3_AJEC8|nr:conserved hypothetical protein [Histoplasma capsulatum H143]EGC43675.1 conserved hypothetical protein [Histoplasma capsulatum var. duboisii H88]
MSARTRKPGDRPLDDDGLGSAEFNGKRKDWDGCDFAYEMVTVYKLKRPITLKEMKDKHGLCTCSGQSLYLWSSLQQPEKLPGILYFS